ncbi:MAG: SDR family oxidoreductase [Pseudomonadota bacterium]
MADLQKRPSAIVSGSATGIGAACAKMLAAQGFNVAVNYSRSQSEASATAEACRRAGGDTIVVRGDVSDDGDCRRIVDDTISRWGRLDVLVNNAGTTRFADPKDLSALSKEDFETIFSVNLIGTYQLTRAAVPYLKQSDDASVINVSSHSAFSGIGSSIAYAASKGALNTLTLSLARALAPEVRVNAVCPGFVDTNWMSGSLDEDSLTDFKAKVAAVAPLKTLVSPKDTAEAVCWFARGGRAITGQLLVIDGGTHLTVGNPI